MSGVLSTCSVRGLDRSAIEAGIPGLILMEMAAIQVFGVAIEMYASGYFDGIWIHCGHGSNGGDGLALARHLASARLPVRVDMAQLGGNGRLSNDAAANLSMASAAGVDIARSESFGCAASSILRVWRQPLLVDALYGTGLKGHLAEPALHWIAGIEDLGLPVLSIDIPSGLDSETGKTLPRAVHATATVTFVAAKPGLMLGDGPAHAGRLYVAGIGIPWRLLDSAHAQGEDSGA